MEYMTFINQFHFIVTADNNNNNKIYKAAGVTTKAPID